MDPVIPFSLTCVLYPLDIVLKSIFKNRIVNNKYVVPGAQPPELFLEILEKAREDEISAASQGIIDEWLGRIL